MTGVFLSEASWCPIAYKFKMTTPIMIKAMPAILAKFTPSCQIRIEMTTVATVPKPDQMA
ncbi:hypothetical protein JCM39194_04740 [Desulfotomaculum varum]